MNAPFSAPSCALVSPDCVRETFQRILRGAQCAWTDEQLEEASGVKARCIKSYRVEGREPSLAHALSIMSALGRRSGINPVLALIGYCGRPLDESDKRHPHQVVTALMAHGGTISKAAEDGRIDHLEEPLCREAADSIIEAVLPLSSAGAAV